MSLLTVITTGAKLLGAPIAAWLEGKRQQTEAKAEAQLQHSLALASSKSDIYLIVIWTYPFWSSFVPYLAPYTKQGFEQLSQLPGWYTNVFISITAAVFGFNKIRSWNR